MNVEFREIGEFPRGTLLALLHDAYSFEPRYERDWLENWRETDAFFWENPRIARKCGFITAVDGRAIGFITWDPQKLPVSAELGHNCIATEYKGKKLGKAQLNEALRRICLQPVGKIRVTTDRALMPAQRNYEGAGFRLIATRANSFYAEYAGDLMDYELIVEQHE